MKKPVNIRIPRMPTGQTIILYEVNYIEILMSLFPSASFHIILNILYLTRWNSAIQPIVR